MITFYICITFSRLLYNYYTITTTTTTTTITYFNGRNHQHIVLYSNRSEIGHYW